MNDFSENLVSVVIPFYNGNAYLYQALASVELNSEMVAEVIIIVDHGSDQPKISSSSNLNIQIVYNHLPDNGAGIVRGIGFDMASAKFVAFLDCDDVWHEKKLDRQVRAMLLNDLAFSFHSFKHFIDGSDKEFDEIVPRPDFTMQGFLTKTFTIGCLTVMIDKSKIMKVKKNSFIKRNDYKMWYDLILHMDSSGLRWAGLKFLGASHRIHPQSLTYSKLSSASYYFIFLKSCGLSFLKSLHYFFLYAINTFRTR